MPSPLPDSGHPEPEAGATAGAACRALAAAFRRAAIPTPELDARLLVCAAAGISHERLVADPDLALSAEARRSLAVLKARRLTREPVSRIVGHREFWGRDFLLSPETLDPRPDSETLIEAVLRHVGEAGKPDPSILDLGTGTGALLVTLLAEVEGATGVGTDRSLAALRTAALNAARHGVAGRAEFVAATWCEGLAGAFDIIVANPPYIPGGEIARLEPEVALHDPVLALDGGRDGLDAYRSILAGARGLLAGGGLLAFEVGHGQWDIVARMLRVTGYASGSSIPERHEDLAGVARCITQRV